MSERTRAVEKYKRMIVALPLHEYDKLVAVAHSQTREPEQQVYHYVRRALSRHSQKPKEAAMTT